MRYILFILMLTGGLLSFNSYATEWPSDEECIARPVTYNIMVDWIVRKGEYIAEFQGCVYKAVKIYSCPNDNNECDADWLPYMSYGSLSKPDDKPSGSPDNSDESDKIPNQGDGSSSGSSMPSPPQPEKPYPDNAGASQLLDLYNSCYKQANSIPFLDGFDNAFNSVAWNCNAILNRLSSVLVSDEVNSLSSDTQKFLTKSGAGGVLSCHKTTDAERQQMIANGYYPSMVPDVIGSYVSGIPYRDGRLNFNYTTNDGAASYCNSVYQDYMDSLNKPSDSPSSSSGSSSGVPASGIPVAPGNGHSDSGNGDNGDVVAAINAFHADANKNHQETIDTFTNLPQETPDLIEGYLSPKLNSIIDSMKKEMTDGYNDALAEFKGVFGDIDSYIPDIKLSFDLPVQFTSGIRGRCVPLVFDFNITLVGFQPYHFHAEGVQACQLYDAYIRSIVEYMLYFLTALACRRVFTRAAEFVSSQP